MKREEREKRRRRVEAISTLRELGYCKRDAAVALQQAEGNVDQAYQVRLLASTGLLSSLMTRRQAEDSTLTLQLCSPLAA